MIGLYGKEDDISHGDKHLGHKNSGKMMDAATSPTQNKNHQPL